MSKKKIFRKQKQPGFVEEDYFVLNCPTCYRKKEKLSRNLFYTYMTESKGVKYFYLVCKNCQATFTASIKDFQTGFREVKAPKKRNNKKKEKMKEVWG